jgi:uncharacterized protein
MIMDTIKEPIELAEGHPIHTYLLESELIYKLISELEATDPEIRFQQFYNLFNHLHTIEKRFERKENQLFPFLEKHHWKGPSQNMWSFHDLLRAQFKLLHQKIENREWDKVRTDLPMLINGIKRLLLTEETVLFPGTAGQGGLDSHEKRRGGDRLDAGFSTRCISQKRLYPSQ